MKFNLGDISRLEAKQGSILQKALRRLTSRPPPLDEIHSTPAQRFEALPAKTFMPKPRLYAYLGPDIALTQLHDGHYIYVDPQDLSMSAHIIAHGFWEKWVETAIRRMTRPGDYVVEIGANLGYHTLIMADCVGSSGKVQTFEANPRLCEHLARSIEFNGYAKRVSLTHAAVSDHSGMINFMVSRSSSGCGHIYMSGENHFADRQVLEVPAVTLDEVCDDRPVNLLRMDTEGSELLILAGASRMLERSPDIRICMEWDPLQTASRSDIQQGLAMMAAHGFRFWKLNTDRTLVETSPEAMRTLHGFEFIACRGSPLRP